MLNGESNIFLLEAAISDINLQILQNSEDLRYLQKTSANEEQEIHFEFAQEEALVRNEMNNTDKNSMEYRELLADLDELQDEEDRKITAIEGPVNDKETFLEVQNASLEDRRDAMEEDLKAEKEFVQQETEEQFKYFQ